MLIGARICLTASHLDESMTRSGPSWMWHGQMCLTALIHETIREVPIARHAGSEARRSSVIVPDPGSAVLHGNSDEK